MPHKPRCSVKPPVSEANFTSLSTKAAALADVRDAQGDGVQGMGSVRGKKISAMGVEFYILPALVSPISARKLQSSK